ncbi:MAG TPA: response regulator transcription factor [Dermatophilaceae bacterium]|jgi:DNA-binding NarL/FixJ family response regulator|nr:response regulator transcription factor [Dermatophilaceae bacterium]
MTPPRIRVGAIDDHPAVLKGVIAELGDLPQAQVCLHARSVAEFLAAGDEVDVVLLDVQLGDGSDVADNVLALVATGATVLLFTQEHRPAPIVRALRAGAAGIVGKHEPLDVLVDAIVQVAAGEPLVNPEWAAVAEGDPELAPREAEAVRLYAAGLPLKSVARRMALSHETVKEYLLRARRKYAAAGRPAQTKTDLFRRAVEDGYLEAP